MPLSPLPGLRHIPAIPRAIAGLVMITFTMLVLTPAAVAARTVRDEPPQPVVRTLSDEAQLSEAAEAVQTLLADMAGRIEQQRDIAADRKRLRQLRRKIVMLSDAVRASFERVGRQLRDRGLPPVIEQRHADTVAAFDRELATLLNDLDAIEAAGDSQRESRIRGVRDRIEHKRHKRTQHRPHLWARQLFL